MWGSIVETALGVVDKALAAYNAWRQKQRDDGLVNTGRQLQAADNLQATVKDAINARKNDAVIDGLSDDSLDAKLGGVRPDPKA